MDTSENLKIVQSGYEAFGKGDLETLLGLLADDVVWTHHGPGSIPHSGVFKGRDGAAKFFSLLAESIEFQEFVPDRFICQEEMVVVLGHSKCLVKSTGKTFELPWVHVFRVKDGELAQFDHFSDTGTEAEAFSAS